MEGAMRAGTLMTTYPATVTTKATIAEALDLMRALDIRHVPVVESGALVGLLSDRDLDGSGVSSRPRSSGP
jgi:CBS domain-containing protein